VLVSHSLRRLTDYYSLCAGGDFEYLQLNEKVANSIYQLNATTQQIVRLSDRIGTKRDTADTREEL
jgi:hypothetical protein